MELCILRVALFTPLRRLFDYLPPLAMNHAAVNHAAVNHSVEALSALSHCSTLQRGVRVRVPFGNTVRIGIIVSVTNHSDHDFHKLKPIEAILDETPLFSDHLLTLMEWASQYYHASLGEVFECALPSWLRKGNSSELIPNPHFTPPTSPPKQNLPLFLNAEQDYAVQAIHAEISAQAFKVFLLEGITGSGKTEVYSRAIEHCLALNRQALILVPEIGLTPQMLNRFQERFSVPIAVLHSAVAEKKRFRAWQAAACHEASIVIGTRSAAFTPLKNPGLFIVDEEHDPSFKQQDSFRYSARDLLIMRGSLEHCPVVLGSATPSLETQQNTHAGRYCRLPLPKRAGNAEPPSFQILDIRHKKLDEGLSAQLIQKMQEHLEAKGQVLLFLNRRGFAPVLMCFDCGFIAHCTQCDARLTVHYQSKKLRCHHCEYSLPMPRHCLSCQSNNIQPLGVGTERLESALKRYFPDKAIIRIDRDTTRQKGKIQEAVDKIHNNEAQVLIGTQMIAKGHHFPNVTLVGILDTDHALFSTDFRSLERFGQLITQVAGRAGRAERLGHVILQTCHPQHPLMNDLIHNGYRSFSAALLRERRATELPPFSHQVLIRAEAKKADNAADFLHRLKQKTLEFYPVEHSQFTISGPVTAPMERKEGKYRSQLLLQSLKRSHLQKLVKQLVEYADTHISRTVRWSLDVDPIDMF